MAYEFRGLRFERGRFFIASNRGLRFVKVIELLRTVDRIDQVVLARAIGVDPSYICAIEAGRRRPSRDVIKRLGNYFAVAPGDLLLCDASVRFNSPELPSSDKVLARIVVSK